MIEPSPIKFAKTADGIHIAYQVVGAGSLDLVYVPGWVTHLELFWENPAYARFLRRLASFARVALFDKRGSGLSDRVPVDELPDLHQRMEDVGTVMDAAGMDRAGLLGVSEGGPIAATFAAEHPDRTDALVIFGGFARFVQAPDYPWGWSPEAYEQGLEAIERIWPDAGDSLGLWAPSQVDDDGVRRWWARYLRMSASPSAGVAMARMNTEIDIRDLLPMIQSPTLLLHRTDDMMVDVEAARLIAQVIPQARLIEIAGQDHLPFWEGAETILDEIEEFLTGRRGGQEPHRILTTLLFTDIVGSTQKAAALGDGAWGELLTQHRDRIRRQIEAFHGREIGTTGDGFLATFDTPASAVRCALATGRAVEEIGLRIRAGVHTGEVEVVGSDLRGLSVHIGARVGSLAGAGEILVSSTVKDLVTGSGLLFADAGECELKGVPNRWHLYRVVSGSAPSVPPAGVSRESGE